MAAPARSPEEIRRSVEIARQDLRHSVDRLQLKVAEASDIRSKLRASAQPVLIGAAAAGFLLGGGVPAFFGLFRSS